MKMTNEKILREETQEEKIFREIIDLLCEDGWQKITKHIDNCYVFVMDDCGTIFHRYLEWDYEYSEWHGRDFWFPGFWLSDRCDLHKDIDDSTRAMVVCTTMPKVTDSTRKALEIMEDYYSSLNVQ